MPKIPTYPRLYQECTILRLARLKEWGYLKEGLVQSGSIRWSIQGKETSSVNIQVSTYRKPWTVQLSYNYNKEPFSETIRLAFVPSNIGKGQILYFVCPVTGKKCWNLYLFQGRFIHREAVPGAMYETQTYSQVNRGIFRQFTSVFNTEELYWEIFSKGFKRYYMGKPTKRFLRLKKQIEKFNPFEE